MHIAESGFKFFQLLREGVSLKNAALRSGFARRDEFNGLLPPPSTSTELRLKDAGNAMSQISKACTREFGDMFDESGWPIAVDAVRYAVTQSKWDSYQYYYLVGLALIGTNRQLKFCECCGWRLKPRQNGRYCPACSTVSNRPHTGKTTMLRSQRNVHEALKHSEEYQAFMKLRHLGEDYPLLMLVRNRFERSVPVAGDILDLTPDIEYRDAKIALAKVWNECAPNIRARRAASTDAALLEMALKGKTRSEAAEALGMSKSGVTKACRRNPALAAAFSNRGGKS